MTNGGTTTLGKSSKVSVGLLIAVCGLLLTASGLLLTAVVQFTALRMEVQHIGKALVDHETRLRVLEKGN